MSLPANPPLPRAPRALLIGCALLFPWAIAVAQSSPRSARAAVDWDVTQPRGTPRVIDFETDVGTWISVDVAPDGRWLAFNLLASVYRVPIAGGEATNLTANTGVALNFHPRISPNGSTIAFVTDRAGGERRVWLMDSDGSNARALMSAAKLAPSELDWMPDGRNVLIKSQGIWLAPVDSGAARRLLQGANWPSASSDGQHVYYHGSSPGASSGRIAGSDFLDGAFQLRRFTIADSSILDITHGIQKQMYKGSSGGGIAPEISPDGRWLAFARRVPDGTISYKGQRIGPRTALFLRDLETGIECKLMDPIEQDVSEGVKVERVLPGYAWMPDGGSIVIAQGGRIRRVHVHDGRVETIPFSAHVHRVISQQTRAEMRLTDGPFEARYRRDHTASPDGRTVLFQAVGKIYAQLLPDGTPRRLTPASFAWMEYFPSWSPDGQWIAFTTWSDTAGGHLWKVPANGGDPVRVTDRPAEYAKPSWSPDGRELLVSRGSGATLRGRTMADNEWYDLVRFSADGVPASGVKVVTVDATPTQYTSMPILRGTWTATNRIYYVDYENRLVSVRPDGSDRTIHMRTPGRATNPAISPDGHWVAFEWQEEVRLAPISAKMPAPADSLTTRSSTRRVSRGGGWDPRWRDVKTLEFGNASTYSVYRLDTRQTNDRVLGSLIIPRHIGRGMIAFTNAHIVPMTSREEQSIEQATVVVTGSRISCVGNCSTEGADRVIDARGKTIIPGWVDTHAHHYAGYAGGMVPEHNAEHAVYLAYGVTTATDPLGPHEIIFTAAELIEAGKTVGARTFSPGVTYSASTDSTPEDIRIGLERRRSWGAWQSKINMNRPERQWLLQSARELGISVTSENGDLYENLAMVMDGQLGFEHLLAYVPLYSDITRFMGKAQFCYNSTWLGTGPSAWTEEYGFYEFKPWQDAKQRRWVPWRDLVDSRRTMYRPNTDYSFAMVAQGVADVLGEGGCASFGEHFEQPGVANHWLVWTAVPAMTPYQALRVASMGGAEFMGMTKDIGSIEAGKLADLIILNSNPLANIRNTTDMQYVMKGGVLYDPDSLDELWPTNKPFGAYPWVNAEAFLGDDRPTNHFDRRPPK